MNCPACSTPLTLYIIGTELAYPHDREYACKGCGFMGWTGITMATLYEYRGVSVDIPHLVFIYRERAAGR